MTATLENRIRETMHAVAATTALPDVPTAAPAPRPRVRRRRLRLTVLIGAGGMAVAGLGAASASGAFSRGAHVAFDDWQHINPANAIHVATIDGPASTRISVYEAPDHTNGQTCVSIVIHGDPGWTGHATGGACATYSAGGLAGGFAANGGSLSQIDLREGPYRQIAIFVLASGDATSAAVEYGGTSHPVTVAQGMVVGWMPEADWKAANLVGYGADGRQIATLHSMGAVTNGSRITQP